MKKVIKKINSKGQEDIWSYEETPELLEALKNLHNVTTKNKLEMNNAKSI